jgi:glycosyltransferase A (GT-A) superfamily protein (DUF2064 family)
VKTRLSPPLNAEQACDVAWACLLDTIAAASRVPSQRHVILLDGEPGAWIPNHFEVVAQRGEGLGDRLAAGFTDVDDHAIVIAMDTPHVDSASLGAALRALTLDHDSAFGPATDGGYWAIGLRAGISPAPVFDGIPMSMAHTGAAQLERLRQLGLATLVLHELRDVDTFDDVRAVSAAHPASRLGLLTKAWREPPSR